MDIIKTKKQGAEVVLAGTLSSKDIEKFYDKALKAAVREVSVAGFRKGHVPEERVIQEVGKDFLWKDAADRALKDQLEDILTKEDVRPIAPLSLSLKNTTHGEDVSFEITAITPPTVKIENYKDIATKALAALPKEEKDKEIADAKRAFRTQVRAINKMAKPEEVKEGDAKENEDTSDKPLTDDEAKLVGFENGKAVEHFIEGEAEKAVADRAMQKKRGGIAEALIEAAEHEIPHILVQEESRALLDTFKKEVTAQGLEWNDYLTRVKKTEEDVKKDLAPNAEKRIVLDLVFAHIINTEKFELSDEEKKQVDEFAKKLTEQDVEEHRAKAYATEQFLREKVWEALGIKNEAAVS